MTEEPEAAEPSVNRLMMLRHMLREASCDHQMHLQEKQSCAGISGSSSASTGNFEQSLLRRETSAWKRLGNNTQDWLTSGSCHVWFIHFLEEQTDNVENVSKSEESFKRSTGEGRESSEVRRPAIRGATKIRADLCLGEGAEKMQRIALLISAWPLGWRERVWERCITGPVLLELASAFNDSIVREADIRSSECTPGQQTPIVSSVGWMAVFPYTNGPYEHLFKLQPADFDRMPFGFVSNKLTPVRHKGSPETLVTRVRNMWH